MTFPHHTLIQDRERQETTQDTKRNLPILSQLQHPKKQNSSPIHSIFRKMDRHHGKNAYQMKQKKKNFFLVRK